MMFYARSKGCYCKFCTQFYIRVANVLSFQRIVVKAGMKVNKQASICVGGWTNNKKEREVDPYKTTRYQEVI